jgi:hypothetical protein
MNPYPIVKITVLRTDYDEQGKQRARKGTGYLIADGLILTAHHVVEFVERDTSQPIQVEWTKLSTAGTPCTATVANVIWAKHDVAVLACVMPDLVKAHLTSLPRLAVSKVVSRKPWESAGYPAINQFQLKDATGEFGADLDDSTFNLNLTNTYDRDSVPTELIETGWGGMSGAPVFSLDSGQLQAVITVHNLWMDKQLVAVSIPWLLHNEKAFREIVKPAKQVTAQLHAKVKTEAMRILDGQPVLREKLKTSSTLDSSAIATDIAAYLVEKQGVGQAIGLLAEVSLELDKKKPESLKERWEDYLTDVEQLCGWLLINSVDPEWWLQHEASLQSTAQGSVTRSLSLDTQAYVEVIISRSLLQQARYSLDEYGAPVPASSVHDPMVFDGHTVGASDIQILSEIFKQLRRVESAPQDVDKLLADIQKTARALSKRQGGRPIYYIVSDAYLDILKGLACYPKLEEKLAGCVQFICCVQSSLDELSPSREDQGSLLEDLAIILRLKNPKRVVAHA